MTLPGMVTNLESARVREMIFAAAFLPPEGTAIVDSSPWLVAGIARHSAKKGVPSERPKWLARFAYLNGVPCGAAYGWQAVDGVADRGSSPSVAAGGTGGGLGHDVRPHRLRHGRAHRLDHPAQPAKPTSPSSATSPRGHPCRTRGWRHLSRPVGRCWARWLPTVPRVPISAVMSGP